MQLLISLCQFVIVDNEVMCYCQVHAVISVSIIRVFNVL